MSQPSPNRDRVRRALAAGTLLALSAWAQAADSKPAAPTQPCRLSGLPSELQCGTVKRPLDPAKPDGVQIDVHFVVLPALARNKLPDPVLFLAGGPGQSSINVASGVLSRLGRLNNRRDLVFVDQRGTGKSAPLECPDPGRRPLAELSDPARQLKELEQCREQLQKLPYGDLRFFTTTIAMQDVDAVRQALGTDRWNVIGGSYGTRAALELQRQFPQTIRRLLIDGLAPPDMILPASFSTDTQAASDALFEACEKEAACHKAFPKLREQWAELLKSVPRMVTAANPVTGRPERFELARRTLLSAMRGPLYSPAQASALPAAIAAAAEGRFEGLIGLSAGGTPRKGMGLATGMHFSVVCAEDVPRLAARTDKPGADYADSDAQFYLSGCKNWPRGEVPEAFYSIPKAQAPVLLMSGAIDPVTPPRHGERVAKALGDKALHLVVPATGHGVMGLACMRDVVFRFIDAKQDAEALKVDTSCAAKMPRPTFFLPIPDAAREAKP
ncbi:alpha/beta hydrolase [Pelomonas sp. SE-A7]|uniref:alpha/beta hydrolase n=1 Tax=Pelomonas sp. SE-A7 TaxID=3054953 RepID=UPI00259CF545|nr:alpha/beta hydrolase [Pelomonas sp. SE-A7]MDM4768464.1 alpha/beta hydrolase [Pelomonas sp. SE-A7]